MSTGALKILCNPWTLKVVCGTENTFKNYYFLSSFLCHFICSYLYPKQLLSRHYWQPHQHETFALQDVTRRTRHYLPLVREIGRLALSYKANSRSTDLMSTSLKVHYFTFICYWKIGLQSKDLWRRHMTTLHKKKITVLRNFSQISWVSQSQICMKLFLLSSHIFAIHSIPPEGRPFESRTLYVVHVSLPRSAHVNVGMLWFTFAFGLEFFDSV